MKTPNRTHSRAGEIARPLAIGMLVGAIVSTVLLLIASVVMASYTLPSVATTPLALAAGGIGAVAGGFLTARSAGARGLLLGALCGFLLFLLTAIAGLGIWQELHGVETFIKFVVMTVGGAVGGLLGRRRR